jgi:hypothetical protein
MKVWTDKEVELLKQVYGTEHAKVTAERFGVKVNSVHHKAWALRITTPYVAKWLYCIDCGARLSRSSFHSKRPVLRCLSCFKKFNVGENHRAWNGGVSGLGQLVHSYLYPVWITHVMKRDDYLCQNCGTHDKLQVHHIRPYVEIRDLVLSRNQHLSIDDFNDRSKLARLIVKEHNLEDGITFCTKCHKSIHLDKKGGELLETPNGNAEDNQQPSRGNVLNIVPRKVHRLIGEDGQSNNPDTSAAPSAVSAGG